MKTPRSTHTSSNDTLPIVGPLWIYQTNSYGNDCGEADDVTRHIEHSRRLGTA